MTRREALKAALASLPPAGEKVARLPEPRVFEDGAIEWVHPVYDRRINALFETFRSGAFGIACGDRDYLAGLKRSGVFEGLERAGADRIRRMSADECLLLLRYFDRQERFCDGAWASAHQSGFLHALVERLIGLED